MTSEAQKRFLRRRWVEKKESETCCDCPGCETCKGFVRNCTCDHDMEWYKVKYGQERDRKVADKRKSEGLPGGETPTHVNQEAYHTFGF